MQLDDLIISLNSLYEEFKKVPDTEIIKKYSFPFPIAVFGTLRKIPNNCGNTRRMYQVSDPIYHSKAILPHIAPISLHVECIKNASGVGEVYFYSPDVWDKVIIPIDNLEGFSPREHRHWGYLRTLIKVYLLPDDFANQEFNLGINFGYAKHRTIPISIETWNTFPYIPAWIYSNESCNRDIKEQVTDTPVLWSC